MQAVGLVLDAGSLTGVPALDERLRVEVCRSFSATGRAPDVMELAVAAGVDPDAVSGGLQRLADARHLVLGADGAIVMAHPFASMPLGFAVMGQHALWWGGCAWDSFAIPHLVPDEPEALVSTRCPGCGKALAWVVGRAGAPGGEEVAHFLVPMARVWDDVVTTCANQRLFCAEACVQRWLDESGQQHGYVMDLATLWRLAAHWYEGRLDAGYVRREPAQARDYFRVVGLSGPFWGLG
jgi:hypothetical protein